MKQKNDLEALSKKTTFPEARSPVAIIIGVAMAIIVIAVLSVLICILYKRKVKRDDYGKAGVRTVVCQDGLGNDAKAKNIAVESKNIEARYHIDVSRGRGSPLPDIVHPTHVNVVNGEVPPMVNMATHPSANRDSRDSTDAVALSVMQAHMNTKQKMAWDEMLMQRHTMDAAEALAEEQRLKRLFNEMSPDSELPPPPPFMLDNGEGDVDTDASSYQDILDGYHSGDNIDESEDDQSELPLPRYNGPTGSTFT